MTTRAAEALRAIADEQERPELEAALEELSTLVVDFPALVDPPCGDCGWNQLAHESGFEGPSKDHAFRPGPEKDTPFFTESFLYDLLGKEDARSVLAVVRNVLRAAGLSEDTIREKV